MHHPSSCKHLLFACVSINALRRRVGDFEPPAEGWMLDSGAFTEISNHGHYRHTPAEYAHAAARWLTVPGLRIVVSQDFMCEAMILERTGLTVPDHQLLTIERYDAILAEFAPLADLAHFAGFTPEVVPLMPVLQGWTPEDYVQHLRDYGDRITLGMWVGVGSVCKRQGSPEKVLEILRAIKAERPDILLHGFGVKITALQVKEIRELLYSADSMAWSFAARKQGRDANSPAEALLFAARVHALSEGTTPFIVPNARTKVSA
jgi:hypothetical protein